MKDYSVQVLAKDVKVKDYILLDFGYGMHESYRFAKVERIGESTALFDDIPRINLTVRSLDDIITSCFKPDEMVKIIPYIVPMTKTKLKTRLRRMKAEWCDFDEMICSLINLDHEPVLKWGIERNYLQSKPDGKRIGIYFKSKDLLDELKQTTCAFSGKVV